MQSLFEKHRDRPWLFLRNLGNWGDILLFKGAETLATRAGVKWTSYETPEFEKLDVTADHCVYLQGGGGFNEWSSGRAFINLQLAASSPAHLVVQGPMSIGGDPGWLRQRLTDCLGTINCKNLKLLAREQHTFDVVRDFDLQSQGVDLHTEQDTALSFSTRELLALAELETMPGGNYDLIVVREDPEQPLHGGEAPYAGSLRSTVVLDPAYEAVSFRHWMRIHLCARSIVTNRLHSSIVGYLAGKPVSLGPGSYHKNRSVWEFSLRGKGPVWVNELPATRPVWNRLPERLRDSVKLRRARLWFNRVPTD